jgi:hypothetical protein
MKKSDKILKFFKLLEITKSVGMETCFKNEPGLEYHIDFQTESRRWQNIRRPKTC